MAAQPEALRLYWAKHRKGGKKRRSASGKRVDTMASRKTKLTLPMSIILGFTPLVAKGISDVRAGGVAGLANTVSAMVPYDIPNRKISFANLNWGLYPILAGFAVHKFIGGNLGVNRALGRMGIPWIRV